MLHLVFYLYSLLSLLAMLTSLGILARRWLPDQHFARTVSLLLVASVLFFFEHFKGFGSLLMLGAVLTFLAFFHLAFYAYRKGFDAQLRYSLVFVIPFVLVMMWRFVYPNILPGGREAFTDLYFLSHFTTGVTLPANDNWLAGQAFDFYYSFFYYQLGFIGRLLPLSIGENYSFAFAYVFATLFSLAWALAKSMKTPKALTVIFAIAITWGGSALSPLSPALFNLPLTQMNEHDADRWLWSNTRLIGTYHQDLRPWAGNLLLGEDYATRKLPELPLEASGYIFAQGDIHPPLFGIIFLLLATQAMVMLQRPLPRWQRRHGAGLAAIIGLTTLWVLVANTWVFPLQAILVLSFMARFAWQRRWSWLTSSWIAIILGLLLFYPFLAGLVQTSQPSHFNWVSQPELKTPILAWLYWWPVLVITMAWALSWRDKSWALGGWWRSASLCFLLLWLVSWFAYVDDPYVGLFERFNTSLKFWSWLSVLMLVLVLPLAKRPKWAWFPWLLTLSYASFSVLILNWAAATTPKDIGRLHGHAWFTDDASNHRLLRYLRSLPEGITVESFDSNGAYTRNGRFAMFAEKPSLLSWPGHQVVWRGNEPIIQLPEKRIRALYKGELTAEQIHEFVDFYQVDYLLWTPDDVRLHTHHWQSINTALHGKFYWVGMYDEGIHKVGMWQRYR